ncbi:MAG TPA: iron-sulfur cluster assembly scaffold protein, partial [Clostridia bacterium]|nr:iron-sulfur cluster assembly scaffold protein [Clostridia bacterium]
MYSDKVIDHFTNPRNVGTIENADGVAEVGDSSCGDCIKLYLKVKDDCVDDIKYKVYGCASAIATSSVFSELVKGKTLEAAMQITDRDVADALEGLPETKMHCSNLATSAFHYAILNYILG